MPDLKSELVSKVLTAWNSEPEEEPTMTSPMPVPKHGKIKTNLVRDVFNAVLTSPGSTRAEIVAMAVGKGHQVKSSASMLSALIIQGNIREVNKLLYSNQTEYSPLRRTARPIKHRERVKPPSPAIEAPVIPAPVVEAPVASEAEAPAVVVSVQDPAPWSATAFVNSLTPRQARELYIELHQLFTI